MERKLLENLKDWQNKKDRKPLIVNGARQVGKTWLLKEFGRLCFDNFAYISFDNDSTARSFFDADFDIDRIIKSISLHTHEEIKPNKTLLILDEIQTAPKALTALKYFYENAPQYAVVVAGSLLGLQQREGSGWPVGKVDYLNLYPLDFIEFLNATKNNDMAELILSDDTSLINTFRNKLIDLLKQYFVVGGMPEIVKSFVENSDYNEIRTLQNKILNDYVQDFSKHIPPKILKYTHEAWNSIPAHLSRENKKFVFGHIRQGARAKQYEESLMWLENAGLINKIKRISKPGMPLKSYTDNISFKVYLLDIGLLGAMSELEPNTILNKNTLFTEFKGALTEQFVCQQLVGSCSLTPYYWSAQNSIGEVDFIVQKSQDIFAIEVKAEENLRSKSLQAFRKKYNNCNALRFSLSDYREQNWMKNIPLFACMNTNLWN
ncbi:MAG: AAA family ATPase [Coriobacteriia bacterium]|nr:AAA family ATPase [Coriobacteriia bacterium]